MLLLGDTVNRQRACAVLDDWLENDSGDLNLRGPFVWLIRRQIALEGELNRTREFRRVNPRDVRR